MARRTARGPRAGGSAREASASPAAPGVASSRPFEEPLFRAFDPSTAGHAVAVQPLVARARWGVGALLVAPRSFRWEPATR